MVGWLYTAPMTAVVHAFKFRRCDFLATEMGRLLADRFAHLITPPVVIVPVPLSWPRLLSRGYNQADLVATAVARGLGIPRLRLLGRRWRPPQARLSRRRRRRNLSGAVVLRRRVPPDTTVLLVDDVVTTGATLRAASIAIRRGGAARIQVLVGARTPAADEVAVVDRPGDW